jgi:hypothetical protein
MLMSLAYIFPMAKTVVSIQCDMKTILLQLNLDNRKTNLKSIDSHYSQLPGLSLV